MEKLEIIKTYYESKMDKGLQDYEMLGWESEAAQNQRFDVLLSSVNLTGKKLLDVGCGMGNLFQYIKGKGIETHYTGVDILESMITAAKSRNPDAEFHHLDIFKSASFGSGSFDIAYASGIFNIDLGNNKEFLYNALDLLLDLTTEAVVFNLLHVNSHDREEGYSYFHPDDVRGIVERMHGKVKRLNFVEAYLNNDFTVVCFKESQI